MEIQVIFDIIILNWNIQYYKFLNVNIWRD